jgi:hypothetical protein
LAICILACTLAEIFPVSSGSVVSCMGLQLPEICLPFWTDAIVLFGTKSPMWTHCEG